MPANPRGLALSSPSSPSLAPFEVALQQPHRLSHKGGNIFPSLAGRPFKRLQFLIGDPHGYDMVPGFFFHLWHVGLLTRVGLISCPYGIIQGATYA